MLLIYLSIVYVRRKKHYDKAICNRLIYIDDFSADTRQDYETLYKWARNSLLEVYQRGIKKNFCKDNSEVISYECQY